MRVFDCLTEQSRTMQQKNIADVPNPLGYGYVRVRLHMT